MSPRYSASWRRKPGEAAKSAGWLGRQDSNLGMAESKSNWFLSLVDTHSEKPRELTFNPINRLANVSECAERPLTARAVDPRAGLGVRLGISIGSSAWKAFSQPNRFIRF
jgi:hypothetical protein